MVHATKMRVIRAQIWGFLDSSCSRSATAVAQAVLHIIQKVHMQYMMKLKVVVESLNWKVNMSLLPV